MDDEDATTSADRPIASLLPHAPTDPGKEQARTIGGSIAASVRRATNELETPFGAKRDVGGAVEICTAGAMSAF